MLEQGLDDRLWELINEQLRAFVGETAFEELCREWMLVQARAGRLLFAPDWVGAHWGGGVQVDVVAVAGLDWTVHYAFFARVGFTEAAQAEAERQGAMLVDLATLDHDLRQGDNI